MIGKGSRPRRCRSRKRAQALDRYLRLRKKHAQAGSQALWLGPKGRSRRNGVAQLLRRRCKQAGIEQLHPHQLRHTAAHVAAKEGLGDPDMMRIFGWRSRQMLLATGRRRPTSGPGTRTGSWRRGTGCDRAGASITCRQCKGNGVRRNQRLLAQVWWIGDKVHEVRAYLNRLPKHTC